MKYYTIDEIAKEELKAFEEFGFDRWLVKRGCK